MTQDQQYLVERNMGLVGKVIKDKVHGLGKLGVPSYEDLYQIGCIGLCKAAISDKGGCFSTYAYRLIWNAICDELIRATRLSGKEQPFDSLEDPVDDIQTDALDTFDLRLALQQAKDSAQGVTAKGIHCLELTAQGYSSQEIAAIVHAEAATVRMWMTKARRYLRSIPELRQYAYSEVAG